MLEIDSINFRYPGGDTSFHFDMSIRPGEIVGLTGASGSGKSTLLDLVAGFLAPSTGDIQLAGRSILDLPPESRPVSILFQNDNLFDHISAGANVALGLGKGVRADAPQIVDGLEQMGLEGFAHRRASTLSGGQKQRVALARTLLRNRPVLLLDEPFTGLDEETAGPIRTMLAELVRAQQWHTILVSHQREEMEALADRTYTITDGRTRPL
ncbi:ATP-binding cassette domain-containing protein [Pelagibacterium limicola]|uniref:ATP-binding cassette domain-containing protein n=1 Tax=Pelagibacterium limicola TaxID=2791022 RepID=UPI0018AF6C35|nr:ATP-binding cassette domain-containing protein [Pelagibacterium limicola]